MTSKQKAHAKKKSPVKPPEVVQSDEGRRGMGAGLPMLCGLVLLAIGGWSYWPSLVEFVNIWETEPDYSHGYLVLPISLIFLYLNQSPKVKMI